MLNMNLEGLEMIAVLVVVVLFVKVLDRFGLLAASYDGKEALTSGEGGGGDHLLLKLLTLASNAESDSLSSAFKVFNNLACFCLGHQEALSYASYVFLST